MISELVGGPKEKQPGKGYLPSVPSNVFTGPLLSELIQSVSVYFFFIEDQQTAKASGFHSLNPPSDGGQH